MHINVSFLALPLQSMTGSLAKRPLVKGQQSLSQYVLFEEVTLRGEMQEKLSNLARVVLSVGLGMFWSSGYSPQPS